MKENQINPAYPDTMKTIAIDFDGVIHDDNGGYNSGKIEGDIIPGAKDALIRLKDLGYKLVLFSCKARKDRPLIDGMNGSQLIVKWLSTKKICHMFDEIVSEKPACCLFIDDNAHRFEGWENTLSFIENGFKNYWFKIPKRFELLHKTIDVVFDKKLVDDSDADGFADYRQDQIILQKDCGNIRRPQQDICCTFLHEVFHHIFHAIREYDLRDNEKLVQNIASALAQVFKTMEF